MSPIVCLYIPETLLDVNIYLSKYSARPIPIPQYTCSTHIVYKMQNVFRLSDM